MFPHNFYLKETAVILSKFRHFFCQKNTNFHDISEFLSIHSYIAVMMMTFARRLEYEVTVANDIGNSEDTKDTSDNITGKSFCNITKQ